MTAPARSTSGVRQQLRPPGNAAMPRGRFTAPLPFRHLVWHDAELTAPHFHVVQPPFPPQEPGWAVWGPSGWVLPGQCPCCGPGRWAEAAKGQLSKTCLTGPCSGPYSVFTTQWYAANVFLPRRQKYVPSSYSFSLWKISVVCTKRRSVCVCTGVYLKGGKIEFLLSYFPVESLPCSQGSTVFLGCNFGQKSLTLCWAEMAVRAVGTGSKSFDFSMVFSTQGWMRGGL